MIFKAEKLPLAKHFIDFFLTESGKNIDLFTPSVQKSQILLAKQYGSTLCLPL